MCDKGGFNVNFFTAGNYVYIGDDKNQVQCDVIEGACSVQCGGPNTLVCDTGEWTFEDSPRVSSGWLDVTVQIEVFANAGAGEMVTLVLKEAFYYYGLGETPYVPMITGLTPHAASSEEPITLTGTNLGYWIQDYRLVYVGTGRAPQGGNVNNGQISTDSLTTHALCRPEELNTVHNPSEPDLEATSDSPVMKEDFNPDPISENVFSCALGDFEAGSYNVSIYMSNDKRSGGDTDSEYFVAGLVDVYDTDGYFEPRLFSRDAQGTPHSKKRSTCYAPPLS